MNQFYKYNSLEECEETLKLINKRKKWKDGMWALAHKNQTKNEWIIPYDEKQIGDCVDLLENGQLISKDEAITSGWYFGVFSGTFAREREKIEDIHFIYDALVSSYGNPNFPATRSLTFSFLSSCYSLKESLTKKIKASNFDQTFKQWWNIKKAEQDKRSELLKEYDIFMNTEKHGGLSSGQIAKIKLEPIAHMSTLIVTGHQIHADPKTLIMSSEGAFMTSYKDTPMERRFPVGIHEAKYEIKVIGSPLKHLGQDINGSTFLEQMTLIRNYYMQLVYDAEYRIGDKNKSSFPSIEFNGTQILTTK